MRKLFQCMILLLLVASMLLSMAACGVEKPKDPDPMEPGIYTLSVAYDVAVKNGFEGTLAEFTETIRGLAIEFRTTDAVIQWRYDGTSTWYDLVALAKLVGPKGDTGDKGEKGDKGDTGAAGPKGDTGEAGRGILKVEVIDGALWITYTDDPEHPVKVGNLGEKEEGSEGLDFYPLSDGTYGVMGGKTAYLAEIIIPKTHNGKSVTKILPRAFYKYKNLTHIVIPEGMIEIGEEAFCDCSLLTDASVPESVEVVGTRAFYGCPCEDDIDYSSLSRYDPETRPFSMSIQTPDGVFNPFFSTSAYDSAIIGHTQIGMLNTDKKGNIICGESEPTVAKNYSVTESEVNGKKYTTYEFLIKNGIQFSDGTPLTIKDVLFNLYVYLDPAYTGSATIYSTDIVGLMNYRLQRTDNISDDASSSFEEIFVAEANTRIQNLIDYVKLVGQGVKEEDKPTDNWTDAEKEKMKKDYATVAETFRKELETDYNNISRESYEDWGFTEVWQIFLYNDGGRAAELLKDDPTRPGSYYKDSEGNYQLDPEKAKTIYDTEITDFINDHPDMSRDEAIKAYCINSVYVSYFPEEGMEATTASQFESVVKYWATAQTILDRFTAEAKSDYFAGSSGARKVPNVSGITTRKTTSFKGEDLGEEYDVLTIMINDVDPKAIYNFAFMVAPMNYYSTNNWKGKDYIAAFNGVDEFGLEFGSIDFMNEVINASTKVGLPIGAGPYKASNAQGTSDVTGDNFFNNNFVYYERNTYFHTVGKQLSDAKIKYIRYKVVESDQIMGALANGDIDYGDPSATQENIAAANAAGLGHVEIKSSGYGYVGINPRFVPDVTVRRAIMKAMNTALITQNYYKGGLAELIWRPMSMTSWAYPQGVGVYTYGSGEDAISYAFDSTGYEIEKMLKDAGYEKVNGVYQKTIPGFGVDRLGGQNYKFTIAGGSTDHPAYAMFLKAAEILNKAGMEVKVVTSQTAMSDLTAGTLSVWAAWSPMGDPNDMYARYHMDSQASFTSSWGYKQIKAGKNTEAYSDEYEIITELSELIDKGRSTTDQSKRKEIYAEALDKVMELAVEMPTYQRKDMSAYNKTVLKESSMTPESERSPYNGLLSRIWELNYN